MLRILKLWAVPFVLIIVGAVAFAFAILRSDYWVETAIWAGGFAFGLGVSTMITFRAVTGPKRCTCSLGIGAEAASTGIGECPRHGQR